MLFAKDRATIKFLREESCKQKHLFEHFQNPGHTRFKKDVCISLIDKTGPFIPTRLEDARPLVLGLLF